MKTFKDALIILVSMGLAVTGISMLTKDTKPKIYKTDQNDYMVSFIGISSKETTPEDIYKLIASGDYIENNGDTIMTKSDYGEAFVWHVQFQNMGLLLKDSLAINNYSINIRRHDLSEKIPTIENVEEIPILWFGFWGQSMSANMEIEGFLNHHWSEREISERI